MAKKEEEHENKEFNPLIHNQRKIREDLVRFCREEGIEARDGFFQIGLLLCENYLTRISS